MHALHTGELSDDGEKKGKEPAAAKGKEPAAAKKGNGKEPAEPKGKESAAAKKGKGTKPAAAKGKEPAAIYAAEPWGGKPSLEAAWATRITVAFLLPHHPHS